MNRLPTSHNFERLGIDQGAILDWHRRQIEDEVAGLKSGTIWTTNGLTKERALTNAHRRMKRLEKLARDFGYWQEPA